MLAEGIDTISDVYINDKLIGKTDNMFVRYKFDIKNALKTGNNKIRVDFHSAPKYSKAKYEEYKNKYKYDVKSSKVDILSLLFIPLIK